MSKVDDKHEAIGLLKHFMDYYGIYHHHKESMAWVATAFYVAGIAYITHAVRNLACRSCEWQVALGILIIIVGGIAFGFVWWQFRRRSEGGDRVIDCYRILLQEYNNHPIDNKDDNKLNWLENKTAEPSYTAYISYTAIIGITILAVVFLNVCT